METLKELKQNRTKGDNTPFFLAVGFHKPHLPFFAPSKYCDLYPPAQDIPLAKNPDTPRDMPPVAWSTSGEVKSYPDMAKYNLTECRVDAKASMNGTACQISDTDAQILRRAYYSSVSFTDNLVGLSELENQGFSESTIVVFWADHGWKLGEHNMWGKFTNLEDDTRVPFMLRVPGITNNGMRTNALVELIDIFPSLTELAGLPVPQVCPEENKDILTCVEGTSVVPLLRDPEQEWKKAAFSQYPRPSTAMTGLHCIPREPPYQPQNQGEDVMGYAIRVDTYRFVEWYGFNRTSATPNWDDVWGTELYDHSQPVEFFNDENANIAGVKGMQLTVRELRNILQAGWRQAVPNPK